MEAPFPFFGFKRYPHVSCLSCTRTTPINYLVDVAPTNCSEGQFGISRCKETLWSGEWVFSQQFPPNINIHKRCINSMFSPDGKRNSSLSPDRGVNSSVFGTSLIIIRTRSQSFCFVYVQTFLCYTPPPHLSTHNHRAPRLTPLTPHTHNMLVHRRKTFSVPLPFKRWYLLAANENRRTRHHNTRR